MIWLALIIAACLFAVACKVWIDVSKSPEDGRLE